MKRKESFRNWELRVQRNLAILISIIIFLALIMLSISLVTMQEKVVSAFDLMGYYENKYESCINQLNPQFVNFELSDFYKEKFNHSHSKWSYEK